MHVLLILEALIDRNERIESLSDRETQQFAVPATRPVHLLHGTCFK